MRKLVGACLSIALALTAVAAVPAAADPGPNASENAASILRGNLCGMYGADGTTGLTFGVAHFVENNKSEQWTCKAIVPNTTGGTVRWDKDTNPTGGPIYYYCRGTMSTWWRQVITKNGRSTIKVSCPSSRATRTWRVSSLRGAKKHSGAHRRGASAYER